MNQRKQSRRILSNFVSYNATNLFVMRTKKIGFIGCGAIADKMAQTIHNLPNMVCYAVTSRNPERAEAFARKWNFTKTYDSCEALADDPEIDLVYIATPHTLHYEQTRLCLKKKKAVLCEKPFTVNARQAEELFALSKQEDVFVSEALWTRFMPLSIKMQELLADEHAIGIPQMLTANLGYTLTHKERIIKPELAGGALLDVGIYTLNLAAMVFGSEPQAIHSVCTKTDSGVDAQENITLLYPNGKIAALQSSIMATTDRMGVISGNKGYLIIENINNPERIRLLNKQYETVETFEAPRQITGLEYELYASWRAIEEHKIETIEMPHKETLRIMRQMDSLRKEWNIVYPADQ